MKKSVVILCIFSLVYAAAASAAGSQEDDYFSYQGLSELRIDASIFDLHFVPGTNDRIELVEAAIPAGYRISHGIQGNRVAVQLQRPAFSLPRWGGGSTSLTIAVPQSDMKITANTSSGSVRLEDLSGTFNITTATGSIKTANCSGSIKTRSSTGEQHISTFSGIVSAQSSTGRINLRNTDGRIAAQTSTGAIRGTAVHLRDDSEFRSSTGSIEIDFVNNVETIGFRASTSTGTVQVGERNYGRGEITVPSDGITVFASTSTGRQIYQ